MVDGNAAVRPAPALLPALGSMTSLQALVALALFAPGVVAPRAHIEVWQLSMFSCAVFAVGIPASFWGGGLIARVGSLRIASLCAAAIVIGMALAALGSTAALLAAGLCIGLAMGPETPASAALLARLVTAERRAFVFSVRQTGNQIGAICGSLALPAIAIAFAPAEDAIMPLQHAGLAALHGDSFRKDPTVLDPDIAKQIERGLSWSGVDVAAALLASTAIANAFPAFFTEVDLLLAPTVPCVAWPLTQLGPDMIGGKPASPRAHAVFTPFVNHAHLPAISIPCGTDRCGLSFGLQIIAARGQDRSLLGAAQEIETILRV
ncbi:MFS transporter [Bradyrhizobium sp. RP6]|uniref:MFS transporter n=1 Tax=Bradyrhizobium sp. RP6 TaxID=2489596 RepID=UPI000F541AF3|nr:MFS transporter [Bradyrhizobium sp. RP6]RQH14722.1 MFS transporter [Bradyrhizobium sp. RP6]